MSIYGDGCDLIITNDCNINNSSSNLGSAYQLPNGYTYNSD